MISDEQCHRPHARGGDRRECHLPPGAGSQTPREHILYEMSSDEQCHRPDYSRRNPLVKYLDNRVNLW